MKFEIVLHYSNGRERLLVFRRRIEWSKRTAIKHFNTAIKQCNVNVIKIEMREAY